jgi:hypothetical protein
MISVALPVVATIGQGYIVFWNLPAVTPLQPGSCSGQALFAHISDIHSKSGALKTFQGESPGNAYLSALLADIVRKSPQYLLISGDITDTGSPEDWDTVKPVLNRHASTMKIIMAPGNHDLSQFYQNQSVGDQPHFASFRDVWQLRSFLKAQASLFPELRIANGTSFRKVSLEDPLLNTEYTRAVQLYNGCFDSCKYLPPTPEPPPVFGLERYVRPPDFSQWEDYQSRTFPQCWQRCWEANEQEFRIKAKYDGYWQALDQTGFPLNWIDEENGVAIFSLRLRSVGLPRLGTNAIGYLDERQAQTLIRMVENVSPSIRTIVILEHYPIARGPGDVMAPPELPYFQSYSKFSNAVLSGELWNAVLTGELRDALLNSEWWAYSTLTSHQGAAKSVLESLSKMAESNSDRSYFLLFGHRHLRSFGSIGKLILAEAPNVSSRNDRGFYVGTKAVSGSTSIGWCPAQN